MGLTSGMKIAINHQNRSELSDSDISGSRGGAGAVERNSLEFVPSPGRKIWKPHHIRSCCCSHIGSFCFVAYKTPLCVT